MKGILTGFIFSAISIFSSAQQTFVRQYNASFGITNGYFTDGLPYANGNYLLALSTHLTGPPGTLLIMLNPQADTLWSKYVDSVSISGTYFFNSHFCSSFDGGCVLLSGDRQVAYSAFQLTRLDSAGNLLWSKSYCTADLIDSITNVIQTRDSGFVFMGRTSYNLIDYGYSMVKVNGMGDTLWTRRYIAGLDEIIDFAETPDGEFYFAGEMSGNGMLAKTDSIGNVLWRKTYNYSPFSTVPFREILDIRDDTLLIRSTTLLILMTDSGAVLHANLIGYWDARLLRDGSVLITDLSVNEESISLLDPQLIPVWTRTYPINAWTISNPCKLEVRGDSAYWLLGYYYGSSTDGVYCIATDGFGFNACYNGTGSTTSNPVSLFASPAAPWQEDRIPFQIISRQPVMYSGAWMQEICNVGVSSNADETSCRIFPNPASFHFSVSGISNGIIEVYNFIGEIVSSLYKMNLNHAKFDAPSQPGIYFVKVQTEKGFFISKLIVEKLS